MIISIIPARGNSLGIPDKNITNVMGKPLIEWTLEQAQYSSLIDHIFVSTDSEEISQIAMAKGSNVIPRPENISDSISSSESALKHAIDYLNQELDLYPEIVVFLQATSPLRMPNDIDKSIKQFKETKLDSMFSSSVMADLTLWQFENRHWRSINFDYKNRNRRQDAPVQYVENGSIYIFKPEILEQEGNRLGGKFDSYIMQPWQAHEIDVKEDIELVEFYMEKYLQ